jgi:hypothetical protein
MLCGCMKCTDARIAKMRAEGEREHMLFPGPIVPGWRYACEICGNKRCPHHTDHTLACTNSNKPGQPGSAF